MSRVVVANWWSLLESDAGFESPAASDNIYVYIVLDCGGIAPPIAPAEPVVNGVYATIYCCHQCEQRIDVVNVNIALMLSM